MPIGKVQFGSIYGINPVKPQQPTGRELATNFRTNHGNGELKPVVQNEVLANKLDVYF